MHLLTSILKNLVLADQSINVSINHPAIEKLSLFLPLLRFNPLLEPLVLYVQGDYPLLLSHYFTIMLDLRIQSPFIGLLALAQRHIGKLTCLVGRIELVLLVH